MQPQHLPAIEALNSHMSRMPIAIVGMASVFPQAKNLAEYWNNIVNRTDCITDVPASRWNIDDYYDPDPHAPDKTYCKRGGFIPDLDFNPLEFGLPPNILEVTDVAQILSLMVAKQALQDAGYDRASAEVRDRTGVILGVGGGQKLITPLTSRLQYPIWEKVLTSSGLSAQDTQAIIDKIKLAYIGWEENSFPGMLGNAIAGRIANRLDLGGINCVVDAACASSLSALQMALSELIAGRSDMMITGGVDTDNSIFMYLCFSKTPAFSKSERMRPFDVESDGTIVGEGIGMMVLKRLEDAERAGDRIYAVIKGMGSSSDGKYKSIYAPRASGQVKALRRAYENADCSPQSVGSIEAHGTGTVAGDAAELTALQEVFSHQNSDTKAIALGSVKSQIGHTKSAAGAASLIKTALALHHKILPPTLNITQPNPQLTLEHSPFYLNTETRPWLQTDLDAPRRAGVSAFGFGGSNYHVVLEEYHREHDRAYRLHTVPAILLFAAPSPTQLLAHCEAVLAQWQSAAGERFYDECVEVSRSRAVPTTAARMGFVATNLTEARVLLSTAIQTLQSQIAVDTWQHPQGIHYRQTGMDTTGKVVALFPGQGSQYLNMGRELALNFPCVRQALVGIDRLFHQDRLSPISNVVYPHPVFDVAQRQAQANALQQTAHAQPAIGAVSVGMYRILQQAGFQPDFVAGHSFGEVTALWAAGVLSDEDYFFLVKARGQALAAPAQPNFDAGTMLAITGDLAVVREAIQNLPTVTIANWNSQQQVVLAGTTPEITSVQHRLTELGCSTVLLPVSAAFHTPLVSHAYQTFTQAVRVVNFNPPQVPVYSNVTGMPYPTAATAIGQTLTAQLLNPVCFQQEVEQIYAAGGRIFVEIGPRSVLTHLVQDILSGRPHLAIALNPSRNGDSDRQLRSAVMQLQVAGLPLQNLDPYGVAPVSTESHSDPKLTIRLNGSNYVSDKTKAAFEDALTDGHKVTVAAPTFSTPEIVENPVRFAPVATFDSAQSELPQIDAPQLDIAHLIQPLLTIVSEKTGYPAQMLTLEMDLEADLGIDSIKRVEILGAMQEKFAQLPSMKPEELAELRTLEQIVRYLGQQQDTEQPPATTQVSPPQVTVEPPVMPSPSDRLLPIAVAPISTPTLANSEPLISILLAVVSEKTGYPAAMLTLEMDMEADLGIDSIKRVEILGAMQEQFPNLPALKPEALAELRTLGQIVQYLSQQDPPQESSEPIESLPTVPTVSIPAIVPARAATQPSSIDEDVLVTALLNVVSDKTGYPAAMLNLSMDLEADLGIDSIKRVEILGAIQAGFPDLPPVNPEALAEMRTLAQIVEYMGQQAPLAQKKTL